jgi:hypothetical protein
MVTFAPKRDTVQRCVKSVLLEPVPSRPFSSGLACFHGEREHAVFYGVWNAVELCVVVVSVPLKVDVFPFSSVIVPLTGLSWVFVLVTT